MNRADRVRCRGSVSLLALISFQFLALGGCAVAVASAASAASAHSMSAADAVAHATVSELAADPSRAEFAVALQSGAPCVLVADSASVAAVSTGDSTPACAAALTAARQAASANGARLVHLTVGADPRAYVPGRPPALFEVLAETEIPGPLAGTTPLCADHQSRHDYCWAYAWSGARETG